MGRTARLRIHDALLEVAFYFPGERFGDVTDGQKAVTIDQDTSGASFHRRLLRDLDVDLQVSVLVLKLFHDGLKSGEFVFVSRPGGTKEIII
jgi:hypothetical protein